MWFYRGADKSLTRPGRKQARKHVRDARDFNNIETQAVIKFFFSCKSRSRRKFTPFWQETSSEACQGRARFQQHRDASCHQVLFFLQGKAPKEIHVILTRKSSEACQGRARFQQHRDASCHQVFFFPVRQGAEGNSCHSDRYISLFRFWLG